MVSEVCECECVCVSKRREKKANWGFTSAILMSIGCVSSTQTVGVISPL